MNSLRAVCALCPARESVLLRTVVARIMAGRGHQRSGPGDRQVDRRASRGPRSGPGRADGYGGVVRGFATGRATSCEGLRRADGSDAI